MGLTIRKKEDNKYNKYYASAFGVIENNLNNYNNLASAFGRRKILRLYSTLWTAGSRPHPMASAQQEREDNEDNKDNKYYAMQILALRG